MIRAVLFDLDGTLLHSAPDLVGALNVLRVRNGLEALPVESVKDSASRGALGLLEVGMPEADAETVERWRLEFLAEYEQNSYVHSGLFEGAEELIEFFERNGMPWGVVTNKPEFLTTPILSASRLGDSIACVVCGDTLEERKPHPAPVLYACEQMGLPPKDVLFVGDDVRDIEAGRAAGTPTCAALYGYGAAGFLEPQNHELHKGGIAVESLWELLNWLSEQNPLA